MSRFRWAIFAKASPCSGGQTKRGPVYIWHADIDEGARIAVDIATDFIPGVSHAKDAYDAYSRIQNGEDPVEVLAAAGAAAALGLIPGLKAARKIDKILDKAEDVADAAGDVKRAAKSVPEPKSLGAAAATRSGDLKKVGDSYLKGLGIDAHAVKADFVPGEISRWNISSTKDGHVFLTPVRKGSSPPLDTGLTLSELADAFPFGRR